MESRSTTLKSTPSRRIARIGGIVVLVVLAIDLLYAVAATVFLNTPIFAKVTGMEDTSVTHVRAYGAWSPFPGLVYARRILVSIRDANVEIDIQLHRARVPFSPRALLERRVEVRGLRVPSVETKVHLRTPSEKKRWIAEHPDPDRGKPTTDETVERLRQTRWTIHVPTLTLDRISPIDFESDRLEGGFAVRGGFKLFSGIEAEVYPTDVTFSDLKWTGGVSNINGTASMRFRPFFIPRTSGSEVMGYLDADAKISGRTESFDFVNLTLRSLEGFGLAKGHADFVASAVVRSGKLRHGTRFETPDGPLELRNDDFRVKGDGFVRWWVPPTGNASRFLFELRRANADARFGSIRMRGGALRLGAEAAITGVDLRNPFTALYGNFFIRRGFYSAASASDGRSLEWKAEGTMDGSLAGATSGNSANPARGTSDGIRIAIQKGSVRLPSFGASGKPLDVEAKGTIRTGGRPIVLTREASLPSAVVDLRLRDTVLAETNDSVRVRATLDGPRNAADRLGRKAWIGRTRVIVSGVDAVLDRLSDEDMIPSVLGALASTRTLEARMGWELREDRKRVSVASIRTNGRWSAKGNFATETGGKWLGLFDATVLGLPVAIAASPKGVEWKIDPGLAARDAPPGSFVGGRMRDPETKTSDRTQR